MPLVTVGLRFKTPAQLHSVIHQLQGCVSLVLHLAKQASLHPPCDSELQRFARIKQAYAP